MNELLHYLRGVLHVQWAFRTHGIGAVWPKKQVPWNRDPQETSTISTLQSPWLWGCRRGHAFTLVKSTDVLSQLQLPAKWGCTPSAWSISGPCQQQVKNLTQLKLTGKKAEVHLEWRIRDFWLQVRKIRSPLSFCAPLFLCASHWCSTPPEFHFPRNSKMLSLGEFLTFVLDLKHAQFAADFSDVLPMQPSDYTKRSIKVLLGSTLFPWGTHALLTTGKPECKKSLDATRHTVLIKNAWWWCGHKLIENVKHEVTENSGGQPKHRALCKIQKINKLEVATTCTHEIIVTSMDQHHQCDQHHQFGGGSMTLLWILGLLVWTYMMGLVFLQIDRDQL